MKLFPRIHRGPDGLSTVCGSCGNLLESRTALGLAAGILDHLRRRHRSQYQKVSFDEVRAAVMPFRRAS